MIMVSVADRRVSERATERQKVGERDSLVVGVIYFSPWHTHFLCMPARPSQAVASSIVHQVDGLCLCFCYSSLPLSLSALVSVVFLSIFCCANDTCVSDLDLFALSLHTLRRLTRLARILLSFWWPRAATFISLSLYPSLIPFAVSSCSLSLNVLCF